MLDAQHQTQPRCGLTKLMQKYDLAPHTTKEGKFAWCLQPVMDDKPSATTALKSWLLTPGNTCTDAFLLHCLLAAANDTQSQEVDV